MNDIFNIDDSDDLDEKLLKEIAEQIKQVQYANFILNEPTDDKVVFTEYIPATIYEIDQNFHNKQAEVIYE